MIRSVSSPGFKRINYDLRGLSFLERFSFIKDNPPRIRLTTRMFIVLEDGTEIVVPEGFVTDGASIPRPVQIIPGFSPFGVLFEGGIPHDFGYQYGYLLTVYKRGRIYPAISHHIKSVYGDVIPEDLIPVWVNQPQKTFDVFFKAVCKAANGAEFVPWSAYKALRLSGHHAWNNYRGHGPSVFYENVLGYPGITNSRAIL